MDNEVQIKTEMKLNMTIIIDSKQEIKLTNNRQEPKSQKPHQALGS